MHIVEPKLCGAHGEVVRRKGRERRRQELQEVRRGPSGKLFRAARVFVGRRRGRHLSIILARRTPSNSASDRKVGCMSHPAIMRASCATTSAGRGLVALLPAKFCGSPSMTRVAAHVRSCSTRSPERVLEVVACASASRRRAIRIVRRRGRRDACCTALGEIFVSQPRQTSWLSLVRCWVNRPCQGAHECRCFPMPAIDVEGRCVFLDESRCVQPRERNTCPRTGRDMISKTWWEK